MAVDMFINMGDKIKGETKDKTQGPLGDIDVLAWSWGVSQSGSFHYGGGGGAGKANFQDISFTKYVDKATPAILLHCANGTHIDKVVLMMRKAGTTPQKYLEYTLQKVMVTGVSSGGSSGEETFTESVVLNFAKVKVEYFMQDDKGITKSAGEFTWDIEANANE